MFASQIRQAIEAAPQDGLPAVASLLWSALGAGGITEAEAEALDALIQARTRVRQAEPRPAPRARGGSRPRSDASMTRRRGWAAAGRLPPSLACQFTQSEVAVLAVVAWEVAKRGDCRLAHSHVAAVAGVSKSTVRAALRRARVLGLITSQERRLSRYRSDPNVVRIVAPEWVSWMKLTRRDDRPMGGVKSLAPTNTLKKVLKKLPKRQGRIHQIDHLRTGENGGSRKACVLGA